METKQIAFQADGEVCGGILVNDEYVFPFLPIFPFSSKSAIDAYFVSMKSISCKRIVSESNNNMQSVQHIFSKNYIEHACFNDPKLFALNDINLYGDVFII